MVIASNVRVVSAIGKCSSLTCIVRLLCGSFSCSIMLLFCHGALQSCDKDNQNGKRPSDALRKTEEEAASLTRFTLYTYCADVEKTA